MLLRKVHLKNFISHKESLLNFDYGINIITGPNGAGKTSILDAISFALFNMHSRGTKDKLVNSTAKKAEVAIEFVEAGNDYTVKWTIEKGKAAYGVLYAIRDGVKTAIGRGGAKTLIPEIEKILGIDKNLFVQSVYVRQGEIENLVTATPAKRKEIISKLLGVDHLEKAWANMREIIRDYEQRTHKLSGMLERIPNLQEQNEQLNRQIKEHKDNLKKERQKLSEIERYMQTLKTEIERLDEAEKKFKEISHQKELLQNNLNHLKSRLAEKQQELEKAAEAERIIKELEDEVEKLPIYQDYIECLRKKEKREGEIEKLQKDLDRVEHLTSKLSALKNRHEEYKNKKRLLENLREKRKNFEGAKQSLEKTRDQLKEYEKEELKRNTELNKEIEKCSEILGQDIAIEKTSELDTIILNTKSELETLRGQLENEIQECDRSMGELQQKLNDLKDKISKISEADVCPLCGRELTPEHVEKLQAEFKEETKRTQIQIQELEEKRKKASRKKKEIDKTLKKVAAINPARIRELIAELNEIKQKIEKLKTDVRELQEKANRLKHIDAQIEKIERSIKEMEKDYMAFEAAKQELSQYDSKEKIEEKLQPLKNQLREILKKMEELQNRLGYILENPEEELKSLIKKKQTYDRNLPIACRKQQLEQEISQIEIKISKLRIKIEQFQKEIEMLAYDENKHRQKKKELENMQQQKQELQKNIKELETRIEENNKQILQIKQELTELHKKKKEKKKIDSFIRILEIIRQAFSKDGIQKVIRARAKPLLERFAKESFEKFNLEYSDVKIDDDYNISVAGPQGIRTIDQISGGERVALAIALRLAIARVLGGKIETLILDEPTTHLDEERRKELVNILNSFFREGGRIIPQMIVITHHEELEEVADIVYNVRKIEGYSTVKMSGVNRF